MTPGVSHASGCVGHGRCLGRRNQQVKCGSAFRTVFAREHSAVAFDQTPRDGQTEAGAVALGGEERLEDAVDDRRRDAGAVVGHGDVNELRFRTAASRRAGRRDVDMDRAAAVDGIARVEDKVGDHLFEMFAVAADEPHVRIHRAAERDRRRKRGHQLPEERRQPDRGVDGEELRLFRIGEAKDFLRGALAAADRSGDVAEGIADDGRERIGGAR